MQRTSQWSTLALPDAQCFTISSAITGEDYRVLIRIPPEAPPENGYPALWMLDGDASFPLAFSRPSRRTSSRKGATASGLVIALGFPGAAPFDVKARARNYTPAPDRETGDQLSMEFGGASAFLSVIANEIRPAIANRIPIDMSQQTLFGFSYGGLFTVNALLNHPGHFQRYWAASPSLWFSDGLLMRQMRASPPATSGERLTMTVGNDEQYSTAPLPAERQEHLCRRAMVDNTREAAKRISDANPDLKVELVVARDHDHFDMLMHGVRRAQSMAFDDPLS